MEHEQLDELAVTLLVEEEEQAHVDCELLPVKDVEEVEELPSLEPLEVLGSELLLVGLLVLDELVWLKEDEPVEEDGAIEEVALALLLAKGNGTPISGLKQGFLKKVDMNIWLMLISASHGLGPPDATVTLTLIYEKEAVL